MIYTGENEITNIMIGDTEIYGIYAGDLQIYPTDFGTLTGITIEDLVWVEDIPRTGGIATSGNCSFKVMAHYDSGKSRNVKSRSTITGSLVVPASTATTREMVGTLTLTADYEGFTDSDSVDVYQNPDFTTVPLTFEILSDGYINWKWNNNSSIAKTIQYSKNGDVWTSLTASNSDTQIPVVAGDKVEFRGDNVKYGDVLDSPRYNYFNVTAQFNLYGNIMSLINSTDFATLTQFQANSGQNFVNFFANNATLISAENLKLPAVDLHQQAYFAMFYNCTNLTKAPESVGTSETRFTYTSTYNYVCRDMFRNCTSLVKAPALPATVTRSTVYENMFAGCTSLETAPELPASSLASYCYQGMFNGCSNLKYIKCLATYGIDSAYSTNGWVSGVASTGTFVKDQNANWPTGNNGIPSGWTIIDAS